MDNLRVKWLLQKSASHDAAVHSGAETVVSGHMRIHVILFESVMYVETMFRSSKAHCSKGGANRHGHVNRMSCVWTILLHTGVGKVPRMSNMVSSLHRKA